MPPPPPLAPQGYGDPNINTWLPLTLSILTIFCCWPIGIVGIVLSIVAMTKKSHGDYDGARTMAKVATILSGIFFALGVIGLAVYIAAGLAGAFD
jgi:hypothetical protein